jgi:methylated-DNA-[protein]-cysteine S-methyltransferase
VVLEVPLLVLGGDGKVSRARLRDYMDAVKALLLTIPPGSVTTYYSIARLLGLSPRLVGYLLASNDEPLVVPCHRVVRRDGSVGGYSMGGASFKRRILEAEGVEFRGGRVSPASIIDLEKELGAPSTRRELGSHARGRP